jgi:hypothetical protein
VLTPKIIWIALNKLDFGPGAPVKKLTLDGGQVHDVEVEHAF